MNLPNKLTMLRLILIPVFMGVLYWDFPGATYAALVIFIIASFTDLLDGKIARKYNLVTDFGKLMDPLADKFMVIGAMTAIVYRAIGKHQAMFIITLLVVVFRELAVTSMRLVASSSAGKVVAANLMGKIKTVMQIIFVVVAIMESELYALSGIASLLPTWWVENIPLSYFFAALTVGFTVASGVNYLKGMWKYLDPEK